MGAARWHSWRFLLALLAVGGCTPRPPAAPEARGKVLEIVEAPTASGTRTTVTLSLGAKDGVRKGDVFIVVDGGVSVAEVAITHVGDAMASGVVRQRWGAIRKGCGVGRKP